MVPNGLGDIVDRNLLTIFSHERVAMGKGMMILLLVILQVLMGTYNATSFYKWERSGKEGREGKKKGIPEKKVAVFALLVFHLLSQTSELIFY